MAKRISDEIRKWADDLDSDDIVCTTETLYTLADRIDFEMVELPKDIDGEPICINDEVYLDDGRKAKVDVIRYEDDATTTIRCCMSGMSGQRAWTTPAHIIHSLPNTLLLIADELDEWCGSVDVDGDACGKPRELADRIRRLAAKESQR